MKFKIYFMRGDTRVVKASSKFIALEVCKIVYPETIGYDVLSVIEV